MMMYCHPVIFTLALIVIYMGFLFKNRSNRKGKAIFQCSSCGYYILLTAHRLDIVHHTYLLLLDNKLHLAPIGPNPTRILDVGTGTGIWAIDAGE